VARPIRALAALAIAALSFKAAAQSANSITIRMIDARTGHLISTTDFLVTVDHQQTVHADWVHLKDDGAGEFTVPAGATTLSVHGKYDNSMEIYVNCDTQKKGPIPAVAVTGDEQWYSIADILSTGIVARNGCGFKLKEKEEKDAAKFPPKPGEFIFFVRKLNWREGTTD